MVDFDSKGIPFIGAGACCILLALIGASCFLAQYSSLYGQATDYDERLGVEGSYDLCGGALGEDSELSTGWTQVLKFNYFMYITLVCLYALALVLGPCNIFMMCCMGCAGCALAAALIMTGIRILGRDGEKCRANETPYSELGSEEVLTFASDGEHIRKVWIAQLSTICCMQVCSVSGA